MNDEVLEVYTKITFENTRNYTAIDFLEEIKDVSFFVVEDTINGISAIILANPVRKLLKVLGTQGRVEISLSPQQEIVELKYKYNGIPKIADSITTTTLTLRFRDSNNSLKGVAKFPSC